MDKRNILRPIRLEKKIKTRSAFANICFIFMVIAASLLLFVSFCEARVFFKFGKQHRDIHQTFEQTGAVSAYKSGMLVNEVPTDVEVFVFPFDIFDTVRLIRFNFGDESIAHGGGHMGIGKIKSEDTLYNLLAVQTSEAEQTIVFLFATSIKDEKLFSDPIPITKKIRSVPSYPRSDPLFFIADAERSTSLGISSTTDSSESVLDYYSSKMEADGWKNLTGNKRNQRQGILVLMRLDEILFCQATSEKQGSTTITLLHKRQGMN